MCGILPNQRGLIPSVKRRLARPGRISPAACSSCGRTDAIAVITRQVCDQRGARLGETALAPDGADIQGVAEQRYFVSCPHCRYRATPPSVARRGQRANHLHRVDPFWLPSPRGRIARRFRRSCNTGEGSDRQAGYPHRVALSPGQIKTWVACGRPVGQTRSVVSRPVEDCAECPALAGVRNLGLDDLRPGRPDSHCNFGGVGGWQTGALYPRRLTSLRSYGVGDGRDSAINSGCWGDPPKTAANAVTCENSWWWSRLGSTSDLPRVKWATYRSNPKAASR